MFAEEEDLDLIVRWFGKTLFGGEMDCNGWGCLEVGGWCGVWSGSPRWRVDNTGGWLEQITGEFFLRARLTTFSCVPWLRAWSVWGKSLFSVHPQNVEWAPTWDRTGFIAPKTFYFSLASKYLWFYWSVCLLHENLTHLVLFLLLLSSMSFCSVFSFWLCLVLYFIHCTPILLTAMACVKFSRNKMECYPGRRGVAAEQTMSKTRIY